MLQHMALASAFVCLAVVGTSAIEIDMEGNPWKSQADGDTSGVTKHQPKAEKGDAQRAPTAGEWAVHKHTDTDLGESDNDSDQDSQSGTVTAEAAVAKDDAPPSAESAKDAGTEAQASADLKGDAATVASEGTGADDDDDPKDEGSDLKDDDELKTAATATDDSEQASKGQNDDKKTTAQAAAQELGESDKAHDNVRSTAAKVPTNNDNTAKPEVGASAEDVMSATEGLEAADSSAKAPAQDQHPDLGESDQKKAPDKKAAAEKASDNKASTSAKKSAKLKIRGQAYIPLVPTVPKLIVDDESTVKGLFHVETPAKRQFHVNGFADVSATGSGAGYFGGNMHVRFAKEKSEFRYSNTHGQIGGIAFATHYPHFNKASIVSSNTKESKKDGEFKPSVVATFTGVGDVGVGVTQPASRLHVQGEGNTRLLNVNHWGDVSGCATGIGMFAGNSYVTTESNAATFRYSNSHSGIGAVGLAMNYPEWNQASFITSGTTSAKRKAAFKPKTIATFTHDGLFGVGTTRPSSILSVKSEKRQISINDWMDVSSQGSAGFVGMNAHMVLRASKRYFAFSNTAQDIGAIGVATNFPLINQLSIVASKESSSQKGTLFKPQAIATFTSKGAGFGTDSPKSRVDIRSVKGRQFSVNKFADVSANEQLQGFFAGNGYTVGREFAFSNTHSVVGAVGLATHYPAPGQAAIISSGKGQAAAGKAFKPQSLVVFKEDGSMEVTKDVFVKGDLKVMGRVLNGDDSAQLDMMAAQSTLVEENMRLRERMEKMETMMATLMEA